MKILFNSSLPRSGSTLLQNLLVQNPRFHCSPTSGLVDMLDAARKVFTESALFKLQKDSQDPERFYAFCRGAVAGYYGGITQAPVVIDKSRAWLYYYEWLAATFPELKMVVCVRDIRAILSSMEKLHRNNPQLSDPAANPAAMQFITVDQRVAHWMSAPPVGLSLGVLCDFLQKGLDQKVHFIRYEDLTRNPEHELARLHDYFGEAYFSYSLGRVDQLIEENDSLHGLYGDHEIRAEIQPVKKDWNDILSRPVADAVVQRNQWFYDRFYKE